MPIDIDQVRKVLADLKARFAVRHVFSDADAVAVREDLATLEQYIDPAYIADPPADPPDQDGLGEENE
jgi:hypothetical protein